MLTRIGEGHRRGTAWGEKKKERERESERKSDIDLRV